MISKQADIRIITPSCEDKVMQEVGFDSDYLAVARNKYIFKLIKISNLSLTQVNIIKQTCLSVGADAAVNRNVVVGKIDCSDLMIGATLAQYKEITKKLSCQQFGLAKIAKTIQAKLDNKLSPLKINNTVFDWENNVYLMGVLNITPDSFSDGGQFFDIQSACRHAEDLVAQGADIIDIGGESTRPFSQSIDVEEEIKRVIPVIKEIRALDKEIPISIDTRNSKTAKLAVENGANIINDVSGFDWDNKMLDVVKNLQVPVVIQHSLSSPDKMQVNPEYSGNIVTCVYDQLLQKVDFACEQGVFKENIIVDVGIGFGKSLEDNYELIKRAEEFKSLGCALLYGVSRKSLITKVLDCSPLEAEEANLALASYLISQKVNLLRVHDVQAHKKIVKVLKNL